ncbi:hypothetical protein CVT24_004389 [Panaeolus cyanescens]|uniref:Peptidase S8/S53 domain-containing protein n=1 Tax=Panaeolus cyanescens TaxID=181874 RepID=A0A409YBJ5_9AGAR|nr:hypothetical protein CVT24_004389 [Panaeolus cyanescens]
MRFYLIISFFSVLPLFADGVPLSKGHSGAVKNAPLNKSQAKLTVRKSQSPTGQHIVTVKPDAKLQDVIALAGSKDTKAIRQLKSINAFVGKFDQVTMDKFLASNHVQRVSEDAYMDYESTVEQKDAPWGLARLNSRGRLPTGGPHTYTYSAVAGSCANVYVVDSGININHDDFKHNGVSRAHWGATIGEYSEATRNLDVTGHGTHIAGIVAGTVHGVAKLATVYAVKIGEKGSARDGTAPTVSKTIQALEWVREHVKTTHRPGTVAMALSTAANDDLDAAVLATIHEDIHVVVAAGKGPAPDTGVDAIVKSPARVAEAITVGGMTPLNTRLPSSNFGSVVDLYAPGRDILSAYIGSNTATATVSGSSQATAHVAGIAAYLSCHLGSMVAKPADMQSKIISLSITDRFFNLGDKNLASIAESHHRIAHLPPDLPSHVGGA